MCVCVCVCVCARARAGVTFFATLRRDLKAALALGAEKRNIRTRPQTCADFQVLPVSSMEWWRWAAEGVCVGGGGGGGGGVHIPNQLPRTGMALVIPQNHWMYFLHGMTIVRLLLQRKSNPYHRRTYIIHIQVS